MITKPFDLDDVFLMSEILDKTGIVVDIKKATESIKTDKLEDLKDLTKVGKGMVVAIGVDIITSVMKNMYKAKSEIKQMMANMTDKKIEEVGKMRPAEIKTFFTELMEMEGLSDFLAQAQDLIK